MSIRGLVYLFSTLFVFLQIVLIVEIDPEKNFYRAHERLVRVRCCKWALFSGQDVRIWQGVLVHCGTGVQICTLGWLAHGLAGRAVGHLSGRSRTSCGPHSTGGPNPSCLQGVAVSSESSNTNKLILHLTTMNQPEGK